MTLEIKEIRNVHGRFANPKIWTTYLIQFNLGYRDWTVSILLQNIWTTQNRLLQFNQPVNQNIYNLNQENIIGSVRFQNNRTEPSPKIMRLFFKGYNKGLKQIQDPTVCGPYPKTTHRFVLKQALVSAPLRLTGTIGNWPRRILAPSREISCIEPLSQLTLLINHREAITQYFTSMLCTTPIDRRCSAPLRGKSYLNIIIWSGFLFPEVT